jgi:hypothetical protein
MKLWAHLDFENRLTGARRTRHCWGDYGMRACICLAVTAALSGTAQAPNTTLSSGGALRQDRADIAGSVNRTPDANDMTRIREQQSKQQNFEAANIERKRQIAEDSARLLKLATDLKIEVDKTNKDTLSLIVIRKAEEIERLAHNVKEKMKLTVGPG